MKIISDFKSRLNYALNIRNLKAIELAEKTGVNKGKISRYLKGEYKAKIETVEILAQSLNVNPLWLMGYDVPIEKASNDHKLLLIPVLGKISAGLPIYADENIIEYIKVDPAMFNLSLYEDYFYLKVSGDSMNLKVNDGDRVLIKKQDTAEDGNIVVAIINDLDEATLKRFKQINDTIMLIPESTNPEHQPQIYNVKDVKIIGVAKGKYEEW